MLRMFKQSGKNLLHQSSEVKKCWLLSFDTVVLDCDGVIWVSDKEIKGAVEAINALKSFGKKILLCTNSSAKSQKQLIRKANKMGLQVKPKEIIGTALGTALYLKELNIDKEVYVVGMKSMGKELDSVGILHNETGPDDIGECLESYIEQKLDANKEIGAVVVGFDINISFPKILKASTYLQQPECKFIATNFDYCFPYGKVMIPGNGTFIKAIQACTNKKLTLIGKPNPDYAKYLIKNNNVDPSRTLMVGDTLYTDILFGYNCGFHTLLVETGMHKFHDIELAQKHGDESMKKIIPDFYLPSLHDILQLLCVLL